MFINIISRRTTSNSAVVITLITSMLVILTSCNSSTQPHNGSIKGDVVLVNDSGNSDRDPVDYSGVTVAVYELADLDTTLVRIQAEYPQIGIPASQVTEFDHRNQSPVKTLLTGADGHFSLEKLPAGHYNVVFIKEDWGIRYLYQIIVSEGEVNDLGIIDLYPVLALGSAVENDITFKSDHHYTIFQDTNVLGSATLEPRVTISIAKSCNLRFYGAITTFENSDPTELWKINSAEDIFTWEGSAVEPSDYYASVVFYNNSTDIKNGIFKHAGISIALFGSNSHLKNVLLDQVNSGLSINQSTTILENITIANGLSTGVQITNVSQPVQITNCVFYKLSDAINIYTDGGYNISNSYFARNEFAIRPDRCIGTITHNAFERNDYDIFQFQVTTETEIAYNNFFYSNIWSVFPRKTAAIHNNNFFRTDGYFVWIRATSVPYSYVLHDINATNNYWAVNDIDQFIQDANDDADYPNQPCPHYVIYLPKLSAKVLTAGIQ